MMPEMAVLGGHQGVQQHRRDLVGRRAEPPDPAGRRQQRDGSALAIEDLRARRGDAAQVRRIQPVEDNRRDDAYEEYHRGTDRRSADDF